MELKLYKMHGSKNTFYLLDVDSIGNLNYVALTKWLCQKTNNAGADGLLIVLPSNKAHAKMRVINADGSEASMCGNGLRCVARYICERDQLYSAKIETMKATLTIAREEDLIPSIPTYSVEISPVSFDLQTLPMIYKEKAIINNEVLPTFSNDILFSAVSVPNPHLIGIVNKYYIENSSHQFLLASFLNNENQYTPDGINVSYVYPLSNDEIYVRTFERGVGFTNACGTAMTASALIAFKNGFIHEQNVTVHNPGGFVRCFISTQEDQYLLKLIGNATYIERSTLYVGLDTFNLVIEEQFEEATQYDELIKSYQNGVIRRIHIS